MTGPGLWFTILYILVLELLICQSFDCDFTDPDCGWSWSDGLVLISHESNSSLLDGTAPSADAENNTRGQFLYYSTKVRLEETKLELISPPFEPHTYVSCALDISLHMYNMNMAIFKIIVKAPNSTWETTSFAGNSAHKWERLREVIGFVSQPFHVIIEILVPNTVVPSHIAIDDLQAVDCYEKRRISTDCGPRQRQCSDLICIDAHQLCDTVEDCVDGEDEQNGCDEIPESAFCTFEVDTCGWNSGNSDDSAWVRHRGASPNARTGPNFDHTFQNESGVYMLTKFPPGRSFGKQAIFTSPVYSPLPYYHRNVNSAYYKSCQVRFFYHKYGSNIGELRLYSLEYDPVTKLTKDVELWRSFGNKGDTWWQAVISLPNITHKFQLQFAASRGVSNSDIAIDDFTLSPECFGIGVPENESTDTAIYVDEKVTVIEKKPVSAIKRFEFSTCGAKGRFGPTQLMCFHAYESTPVRVFVNGNGMDGIQKWVVPDDGIYTIFVNGAGGGTGVSNRDISLGSTVRATFHWQKNEVIYLLVGQRGIDACSEDSVLFVRGACSEHRSRRDIASIRLLSKKRDEGGGGGGGGATYIFKLDPETHTKIPLTVAGGGGGLSARIPLDSESVINPNGLGLNNSISPINGFSAGGAGGGGGWDDTTTRLTNGLSLKEGGQGGAVCVRGSVWETHGGFGGGGGGCASGGGGGGYRGGDTSVVESNQYNGYGGTSYLSSDALRPLVKPGSNPGDGSVVVVPAQPGCGCEYLCVMLDIQSMVNYCICPNDQTLNFDGFSCNGRFGEAGESHMTPKLWVITILSVIVGLAVLTICACFGVSWLRKNQTYRDLSHEPLNNPEVQLSWLRNSNGQPMVTEYNPNYEFGGSTCSAQDLKEIPREQLTLVKALGQGAFGEVYQGYLINPTDNSERPVAVKTLPELCSSQSEMDFLMEALIMSKFNHPNIVTFLGVCFEKMPRFIVLELLPGGDLKSFLREHRPKPQKPSTLTVSDLLKLAMDVAKGCQYLEDNHFIHRDIAARNCLLSDKDANRIVKIADFGMARDIYRADYYRKGGKAMLPVKWMPPEAFLDGIFTTKTDVWSFGVLLWEVISLGYMPYPGRGNQEVMQLVTSGGRLEPPTNSPSPVYHIMMQCWHPLPTERPNFTTIIERLGYCLQDPDVINAPLPVFHRPPSMERDATVMRPADDDSAGCCLQVQRPELGSLLSPGSEDYMIPTPRSMYSLTTERSDVQSNASLASGDQLLEMSDRRTTSPVAKPSTTRETNFMKMLHLQADEGSDPDESSPTDESKTNLKHRSKGYTEVPTSESETPQNGPKKCDSRKSSIQSVDALPIAPGVADEDKMPASPPSPVSNSQTTLALDPAALAKQMSSGDNMPRRYINVDVNCNAGDPTSRNSGTTDRNNRNVLVPLEGFAGVNPVV